MSFHNRSDALIELLEALTENEHQCVLVGGYAVSGSTRGFRQTSISSLHRT